MGLLSNKVALVTGASRGIGAAIARLFAREGARVALHGRDSAALSAVRADIERGGGTAAPVVADITKFTDIENLRHQVEQTLGMIDILVANAGGSFTMPGPLEEISEQGWHASVDGNLTATFLIIKSILPGMKERKLGTIATISSAAGRRPHPQAPILYSAAKAGIQILTQVVAIRNSPEVPAANFVLDTSPGKHQVVWKVSGFGQDEAEALLHSLANRFDGDLAATDSTRVLRLPGFANHKLAEEFVVQARQESNAVYALRDFTIDEDSPEAQRRMEQNQARGGKLPTGHKSQS